MSRINEEGRSRLYESLINAEIPQGLTQFEVMEAYMRATCVAAGIPVDGEFLQQILDALAKQRKSSDRKR